MAVDPEPLTLAIRPFFGHGPPPDTLARELRVVGVLNRGSHQTFFRGVLDYPIEFGGLGRYTNVIFYSRGADFVSETESGFVFSPRRRGPTIGYLGIDPDHGDTEWHRRAGVECEFAEAHSGLSINLL